MINTALECIRMGEKMNWKISWVAVLHYNSSGGVGLLFVGTKLTFFYRSHPVVL